VGAAGEELREEQREEDLAGELRVRPRARLGAQEQHQRAVSHCLQIVMRLSSGLLNLRDRPASCLRNRGLTDRRRA
jgi:hypothetical protein